MTKVALSGEKVPAAQVNPFVAVWAYVTAPAAQENQETQTKEIQRAQSERRRQIPLIRQRIIAALLENKWQEAQALLDEGIPNEALVKMAAERGALSVLNRMVEFDMEDGGILQGIIAAADKGHLACAELLYMHLHNYNAHNTKIACLRALAGAVRAGFMKEAKWFIDHFTMEHPSYRMNFIDWRHTSFKDYRIQGISLSCDMRGSTPLHAAIEAHNIVAVNYLLKQGAQMGVIDENGENEITKANRMRLGRIKEILTTLAAQRDQNTLFALIKQLPHNNAHRAVIYDALMKCPPLASTQIKDGSGNTLLHAAASIRDRALFYRIFILNPALFGIKNSTGQLPLELGTGHPWA